MKMNRRDFLASVASGTIAAANIGLGGDGDQSEGRPNILLIVSEDQGWRDAGAYGNAAVKTPNLDRLASQGMRFDRAYCASTLCSPSRAVLNTGLMPFRNGGHVFGGKIKKGVKTFGHYFKQLGYETANVGKFSKHPHSAFPYDVVWKRWKPGTKKSDIPDFVDDFLEKRKTDQPLFLQVCTGNVHMPWLENEEYDLSELEVPPNFVDTPETRDAIADYYTSVNQLDVTVGKVLKSLADHGYDRNTLVVFTSDHGANFPFAKWTVYEEGIHVPFIVRWPGVVKPGSATDAMVSLADVVPTFIEAAGGEAPQDLDGQSFLKVLTGKRKNIRDAVFASQTGNGRGYPDWKANWSPSRAIVTRTHKYILNLNPSYKFTNQIIGCGPDRQPSAYHPYWDSWEEKAENDPRAEKIVQKYLYRPVEELYDLRKDPYELNNIGCQPENARLLKSLRERLANWREKQGDTVPVHIVEDYVAPRR